MVMLTPRMLPFGLVFAGLTPSVEVPPFEPPSSSGLVGLAGGPGIPAVAGVDPNAHVDRDPGHVALDISQHRRDQCGSARVGGVAGLALAGIALAGLAFCVVTLALACTTGLARWVGAAATLAMT